QPAILANAFVIVHNKERGVHDRCGTTAAISGPAMTIVQVKTPRTENLGSKVELRDPIVDDGFSEKAFAPSIHFRRDVLRSFHEHLIPMDRQFEIPLIVQ